MIKAIVAKANAIRHDGLIFTEDALQYIADKYPNYEYDAESQELTFSAGNEEQAASAMTTLFSRPFVIVSIQNVKTAPK